LYIYLSQGKIADQVTVLMWGEISPKVSSGDELGERLQSSLV
jgi:hypothetical protein